MHEPGHGGGEGSSSLSFDISSRVPPKPIQRLPHNNDVNTQTLQPPPKLRYRSPYYRVRVTYICIYIHIYCFVPSTA